jgi:hypothetical protein
MSNIDVNNPFLINDIANKNYIEYGNLNEKLVIEDMKTLFVFTLNP